MSEFKKTHLQNAYAGQAAFMPATMEKLLDDMAKIRRSTELEINGVTINAVDYEEVTERNRNYLPRGYSAFLNVRRTVYDKTFNPQPTDLLIFNSEGECLFVGAGKSQKWRSFWREFIDEKRYTSRENLLLIAGFLSPPTECGTITEDSRRHLEAEIFAAIKGEMKFSELRSLDDRQLAVLYRDRVLNH